MDTSIFKSLLVATALLLFQVWPATSDPDYDASVARPAFNQSILENFPEEGSLDLPPSSYMNSTLASRLASAPRRRFVNAIDGCWRNDLKWARKRKKLSRCAVGYGKNAGGGRKRRIYRVSSSHDDPVNPRPGTLRYAASTRRGPLWIVFTRNMNIVLKMPLLVSSFKTIDGRGANVHISQGSCIMLYNVSNVIIHGLHIHHCKKGHPGLVMGHQNHLVNIGSTDGDGISVVASRHVWIDHNTFSRCDDGLLDVTLVSSWITISNNRFKHQDKVMLFGHNDHFAEDKAMRITVAFNYFGPGCNQRIPRVRFGYVHIVNNFYYKWGDYAIGGSVSPTIISERNYYVAPSLTFKKEVTRRLDCLSGLTVCKAWSWKSKRDVFLNGAYFVQTGRGNGIAQYKRSQRFKASKGALVPFITADAGALSCTPGLPCRKR